MAWRILYLPALSESGQPLWPEMFPLDRLESIKQTMGSPLFTCMYQGRPEALGGDIFQRSWFRFVRLAVGNSARGEKEFAILFPDGRHLPIEHLLVYQFWDLAISEKSTADYTACVTLALDPEDMQLYVLDVLRGHWSFAETQRQIARQAEFWQAQTIGIESIAYQAAAVQEARRNLLYPISEVRVDRDKVTRARLPAALAENGKILVVQTHWTEEFLDEVCEFPSSKHDDMVDAFSGATALAQTYVPSRFLLWG